MDILYVIGKGSQKNNLELRMSLRSLIKYGKNIGKVIVVGKPPKWLSDEALKLDVTDLYSYKHQNILYCIEKAIEANLVKGDFLYSSDDHFYVKPVDFGDYPYYVKGALRYSVDRVDPHYEYHRSLYDTRLFCVKHGFPTMNYSQHCNTHMHTEVFRRILSLIHESYKLPYGVEPTSFIMNAWQTMPSPPTVIKREDLKIQNAKNVADIYSQIGERDCFSISDRLFRSQAIFDFFDQEYPYSSPFENDVKTSSEKSLCPLDLRYPSML